MATAAICTEAYDDGPYDGKRLVTITWSWTSSDTGTVTSTVSKTARQFTGYVAHFTTEPGATTPSSYNIMLKDSFGRTLASKTGASTTAVETHTSGFYILKETLEIAITGADDQKTGTAVAHLLIGPY